MDTRDQNGVADAKSPRKDPLGDVAKRSTSEEMLGGGRGAHVIRDERAGRSVEMTADAAFDGGIQTRDEVDARRCIREIVARRRCNFQMGMAGVFNRMSAFSSALTKALGEVSIDEAIDALKADVAEELERARWALKEHGSR